jgi:hypothetical protein
MRYRDAKKLIKGDHVVRQYDNQMFIVKDIEIYGTVKYVRINCEDMVGDAVCLLHSEIK